MSFFWKDPVLPSVIQLTGYILFYSITDAFNQHLNGSLHIGSDVNSYAFNETCRYETGLTLCPSSKYCFKLRGAYKRNGVISMTIPSNKICLTTPKYRKKMCMEILNHPLYCN